MIKTTYIDHMGSDLSVVNAARVSFGKHSGKYTTEQNEKLIRYLAKHKHLSPFNHTFVTFHVTAPIFVARQLQKHEYMPWNEVSKRYVDEKPELYEPEWRSRSADKKQGSGGPMEISLDSEMLYHATCRNALTTYERMITEGVAPEQARSILPQNMMTEWYWSATVGAVAKMCKLRCASDTQYETRLVADNISGKMKELFPVSWEALMGHMDHMTQEEWEKTHV